ncbi:MAG: hypothetical protein NZ610_02030 [Candidatus Bipolaricaulota bacterium]|nr:hypothetical protein [Candidatus Bipolaricaulota bacterium]MCS7274173.1 hypothetical protein [Candidatus Bipolaricaulota bacterium]
MITVCPEGPPACQFRQIQDAINAAPEGKLNNGLHPASEDHRRSGDL